MEVFFSPKLDDLMAGFEDLANDDAEGATVDVVWAARTTALIKKFEVSRKVFHLISRSPLLLYSSTADVCCPFSSRSRTRIQTPAGACPERRFSGLSERY